MARQRQSDEDILKLLREIEVRSGMKALEKQNQRLKKIVADLELDKLILKDSANGRFHSMTPSPGFEFVATKSCPTTSRTDRLASRLCPFRVRLDRSRHVCVKEALPPAAELTRMFDN